MFKVASIEIPEGLSAEEIYSRLFQDEPIPPSDYGWMNEGRARKRLPPEYRAWLCKDGTEGSEARPEGA
jgi:hypothetical protein